MVKESSSFQVNFQARFVGDFDELVLQRPEFRLEQSSFVKQVSLFYDPNLYIRVMRHTKDWTSETSDETYQEFMTDVGVNIIWQAYEQFFGQTVEGKKLQESYVEFIGEYSDYNKMEADLDDRIRNNLELSQYNPRIRSHQFSLKQYYSLRNKKGDITNKNKALLALEQYLSLQHMHIQREDSNRYTHFKSVYREFNHNQFYRKSLQEAIKSLRRLHNKGIEPIFLSEEGGKPRDLIKSYAYKIFTELHGTYADMNLARNQLQEDLAYFDP